MHLVLCRVCHGRVFFLLAMTKATWKFINKGQDDPSEGYAKGKLLVCVCEVDVCVCVAFNGHGA